MGSVEPDLLSDSGSIFVQIGDENVHRVRALMDEVFGEENFCSLLVCRKTSSLNSPSARVNFIPGSADFIIWFAKNKAGVKYRQLYFEKSLSGDGGDHYRSVELIDGEIRSITKAEILSPSNLPVNTKVVQIDNLISQGYSEPLSREFIFMFRRFSPNKTSHWKTTLEGLSKLDKAGRLSATGKTLRYKRYFNDFSVMMVNSIWEDIGADAGKTYVVQTPTAAIKRCLIMTTDPGDLVLDPTCGSGTTAYVAEQWGRRWITIDTSRVSLALARARIMGARYPYYLLKDSKPGQQKEAALTRKAVSTAPTYGNIRQGFVYDRVPHITLKAIANNAEIDVIWEQYQPQVEQALADLNTALAGHPQPYKVTTGGRDGQAIDFTASGTVTLPSGETAPANALLEWEVPREKPADWPDSAQAAIADFWQARIARQTEIDASIAASADQEFLYDKPYEDKSIARVAGPFTVESLSPHRVLAVDQDDELIDPNVTQPDRSSEEADFANVILETLKTAGVQQADKSDKITFTTLTGWPGEYICAEGVYVQSGQGEGDNTTTKRAGIFIGPEFGTVSRPDLVAAAREAGDAGFDVAIACAFNYDAHSSDFKKLGRIQILKARMNADLHMADTLKNTGAGNLFVIFGEPDIDIDPVEDDQIQVTIHGVDVFHPQSGEVRASDTDAIACWFIDTDYNEESFFVRHAYFLGASDPYKSLKTTLKAEIDEAAWESLYGNVSRSFDKPRSGRIAVKVINHLGDEVMKVFSVE
jgi:adenine-specific DNA-methyltransferase